ncbi:right-handed parallel beta-helix repeat-containing protein [Candidatus Bipolaricaulota bacterium]|nr:right-handed parallel beta-helix repeat-containing protein [Candidatus Bipolaricaulota bacterium]
MKRISKLGPTIPVFILFITLSLSFSVTGSTLQVCKIGCDYSSIGEAIKNSSRGDSIKVQNGNYTEDLRIDRDVSIVGANSRWVRIIPSDPSTPAIVVGPSSARVEISNITVTGEGKRPKSGITVTGDSRLTMTNSRVSNFQSGLTARDSSYLKTRETEVGNSGVGVAGFDNSEVIVSGSSITSAKTGLLASNSTNITVADAEVTGCETNALLAKETAKFNVISSSISNNQGTGVTLKNFSRLNMKETQVSSNESGGLLVTNSAIANLSDNQITYNKKKNVSIISKKCGFSGPSNRFFGEVNGAGNEINPADSNTICPQKFAGITSGDGGNYSYPFKPSTYAFIGLIGAASFYFLISG